MHCRQKVIIRRKVLPMWHSRYRIVCSPRAAWAWWLHSRRKPRQVWCAWLCVVSWQCWWWLLSLCTHWAPAVFSFACVSSVFLPFGAPCCGLKVLRVDVMVLLWFFYLLLTLECLLLWFQKDEKKDLSLISDFLCSLCSKKIRCTEIILLGFSYKEVYFYSKGKAIQTLSIFQACALRGCEESLSVTQK